MEYRINGFEQIKLFYSWVFNNQDKNINATHISLYLFLINQNNRANWVEWFKCPYDLGMAGSCIGSRNTYYKVLDELKNWKLIDYKKGINNYKAPMVKIYLLKSDQLTEQVPIPLCEPLIEHETIPLTEPLSEPLTEHIYKLITNNIKLITDNYDKFEKFILNDLKKSKKQLKNTEKDKTYQLLVDFWLKDFHEGWTFEGTHGKAIKSIINKLTKIITDQGKQIEENTIIDTFKYLCLNLPEWYKDKDLQIIDSKLNEIITQIKNNKNGQNTAKPGSKYAKSL